MNEANYPDRTSFTDVGVRFTDVGEAIPVRTRQETAPSQAARRKNKGGTEPSATDIASAPSRAKRPNREVGGSSAMGKRIAADLPLPMAEVWREKGR
ncbi:hypothetical protein BH09MYX1_BH09MYX1_01930 [soil metagenome]